MPLLDQLEAVNGRVKLIEGWGLCRVQQWKREGISIGVNWGKSQRWSQRP